MGKKILDIHDQRRYKLASYKESRRLLRMKDPRFMNLMARPRRVYY